MDELKAKARDLGIFDLTAFLNSTECAPNTGFSALCIGHNVSLEALEPGTAVLDAQGSHLAARRVAYISSGTVELLGLKITGGYYEVGLLEARMIPTPPLGYFADIR